MDVASQPSVGPDTTRWELIDGAGATYRTTGSPGGTFYGKGGGGGDQLAFFSVPNDAQGPFSLHVVLVDYAQKVAPPPNQAVPPTPTVVVDTVIRLS